MLLTDLLLFPLKTDILPRRWNLQRLGKLFLMVDDNGLEPLTLRTSKRPQYQKIVSRIPLTAVCMEELKAPRALRND